MDRLQSWLTSAVTPLVGVVVGVIAIGIAGYALGWWEWVGRSVGVWFWLGLLILLAIGAGVFILWVLPFYREKRFVQQLSSADSLTPEAEIEKNGRQLRDKMLEAIRTLQSSPDPQKRAPYALPWYLLIGASQSGKTTLLQGVASLFAPFARPSSSTDTPTQNCDWWFFNTAIILDTSGRYAFPTQSEQDRALWYRLLQLLHHYRRLQPINGVIVAIAADTLTAKRPEELQADAVELRRRVDEIIRQLGVDAPIYLLITRCDLIEGFTEFFACLPEQTRTQVLGFINETRPQKANGAPLAASASPFDPMFASMAERLHQLRLSIFNEEKLPPAILRQQVFCFPEEFSIFRQSLQAFLKDFLADNPVLHSLFFRGLFFCSAQQGGTPVSFLRRALPFATQLKPPEAGTGNYFLRDLFSVILPRDQYLVTPTAEVSRRGVFKDLFGFAACIGLCLLFIFLVTQAFLSDRATLAAVDEVPCEAADGQLGAASRLDQADRCRQVVEGLMRQNSHRPAWSKWLFGQSVQLDEWLRLRYVAKFNTEVLRPLDASLAQRLRADAETVPLVVLLLTRIELLKRCLAGSGCADQIDTEQRPDYRVMLTAGPQLSSSGEDVAKLQSGYETYLRWSSATPDTLQPEYEAHIERLRSWFAAKGQVSRQIIMWANQSHQPITYRQFWEVSLPTVEAAPLQVDGAFTREAWEQSILPLLRRGGDAVPGVEPFLQEFRADYEPRYVTQWQGFLEAFSRGAKPWEASRERRLQLASNLVDSASPFNRVVEMAGQNLAPLEAMLPVRDTPSREEPAIPSWVRALRRYRESDSRQTYQDALKEIGKVWAGEALREQSFQLAQAAFQVGSPTEKPAHPVLAAWWVVGQSREGDGASVEAEETVFWQLLQWPLLFVWRVMLEEASAYIQERWEDLLIEVKDLPPGQKFDVLYGKESKLRAFVNGPAGSFLAKRGEQYLPKRLLQGEILFTDAFLHYLQQARVGGVQPEFEKVKRRIQVRPGLATHDGDPQLKVAKTELILECDDGPQVVDTAEASGGRAIVWTVKSCFDTRLRVYLTDGSGQLLGSLERRYETLVQFLEHFSGSSRSYRLSDLTVENAAQLAPYGLRTVTLRYSVPPTARQEILKDIEAYKRHEGNTQARLDLPSRITALPQ